MEAKLPSKLLTAVLAVTATFIISAAPAGATPSRSTKWSRLDLRQTIAAQQRLLVWDWKVITTWRTEHRVLFGLYSSTGRDRDTGRLDGITPSLPWPRYEPKLISWHEHHYQWTEREMRERLRLLREQRARAPTSYYSSSGGSVTSIICAVFGSYCSQAIRVATCESTLRTWAKNGQYLGLFQMGTDERATYGDGSDAWSQARAAYAYFRASGSDWSPWSCKP